MKRRRTKEAEDQPWQSLGLELHQRMFGELPIGVLEGEESMVVIKKAPVGAVGSLNLAVMPGGCDADELVTDTQVLKGNIECAGLLGEEADGEPEPLSVWTQATGKG